MRSWPSLVKVRASQARDRGFKSRTSHFNIFELYNKNKLVDKRNTFCLLLQLSQNGHIKVGNG